jgi:hypothetical protein
MGNFLSKYEPNSITSNPSRETNKNGATPSAHQKFLRDCMPLGGFTVFLNQKYILLLIHPQNYF